MTLLRFILILACALHGLSPLPCTLRWCDQVVVSDQNASCCPKGGCHEASGDDVSNCDAALAGVKRPSCVTCTLCLASRGGPATPTAPTPKSQIPEFDRVPEAEWPSLAADLGMSAGPAWAPLDDARRGEPPSVRRARLCVWVI
jgi:hypothetical protein